MALQEQRQLLQLALADQRENAVRLVEVAQQYRRLVLQQCAVQLDGDDVLLLVSACRFAHVLIHENHGVLLLQVPQQVHALA